MRPVRYDVGEVWSAQHETREQDPRRDVRDHRHVRSHRSSPSNMTRPCVSFYRWKELDALRTPPPHEVFWLSHYSAPWLMPIA